MKPILLLIAVFASNSSYASCWKQISITTDAVISIDDCSIAQEGKYRKAWFKWDYVTSKKSIKSRILKKTDSDGQITYIAKHDEYIQVKELEYFNCASRKSSIVQIAYYDVDLEVIDSIHAELNHLHFDEPVPDSIGETHIKYVCKKK